MVMSCMAGDILRIENPTFGGISLPTPKGIPLPEKRCSHARALRLRGKQHLHPSRGAVPRGRWRSLPPAAWSAFRQSADTFA